MINMSDEKFERAKYDKLQTKLNVNGTTPNDFKFAKIPLADILKEKATLCPFCLHQNFITHFIYNQGFYQCVFCKNKMTEKTILNMIQWFTECNSPNIKEFAKWVYNYRLSGFFQKIQFKEWNEALKDLGLSYDFWGYYNQFKGENTEDEYDE